MQPGLRCLVMIHYLARRSAASQSFCAGVRFSGGPAAENFDVCDGLVSLPVSRPRPNNPPRQACAIAIAIASAASAGRGGVASPRILVTMAVTCFLSAEPEPVTAAFTSEGVSNAAGILRRAPAAIATPD